MTERYIYAVTRLLPKNRKDDVEKELRKLIDDKLKEHCGNAAPTDKDIRIVLTELGAPAEFASKYDDGTKKCLIGQPYFTTYKFVLKVVLAAGAFGITVASVLNYLFEPQDTLTAVLDWLGAVYNCLLAAFAVITLLFAFFYHKGVKISEPFNPDSLPLVPKETQKIPKWTCVAGIVVCIVFTALFLFAPQILDIPVVSGDMRVPFFNIEAIAKTRYFIIPIAVCCIILESVKLVEGRYSMRVLAATLITNAVSALLVGRWLTGFELMHPEFLSNLSTIFEGEAAVVMNLFLNFQTTLLGVILFALVLDSVDAAYRTLRK